MAWTEVMRKFFRCKKKTNLFDLPSDIIMDILLKLSLKTLCCSRCVSKTLLDRIDDPLFVTAHTRLLTSTNVAGEVPRLMLVTGIAPLGYIDMQSLKYDGEALRAETKNNAIVSRILPPSKPYILKYCLEFCYHDLFFYKEESEGQSCFLCNPLRGEVLKLPTINFPVQKNFCCSYGMGFDKLTNSHKIVCVSSTIEGCLETHVLVLGTNSWKKIPSQPPCNLSKKKICAYGDMHWLIDLSLQGRDDTEGLRIISFDFKKDEFYWTPHPTSVSLVDVPFMHLLTFGGSIAIAYVSSDLYINMWVLNNYDTKDWALDYSIDIRMFLEHGQLSKLIYSHSCGEWEHGIIFMDKLGRESSFLDLGRTSMEHITLHTIFTCGSSLSPMKIVGYTGSFISLKDYGQLVRLEPGVETYRMQSSFLQKLGLCFVGATKIERGKQQLWRLGQEIPV
ncbi:F-box/kelch-repeat protein [Rosa sericea]